MQRRGYGNSGLQVSALAYGAMSLRSDPDIVGGVAPSLLRALDNGITLVDTARGYPESEALIASTLKHWSGPAPLLSTKVLPLSRETFRFYQPLEAAYTRDSIRQSVETSLRTLGVETLDIVHLHQWHYLWSHETAWLEELGRLKAAGKIRCIAISAQDHEHDALLEIVNARAIDGVQVILNLFESRPMNSLLPLASRRGTGVIARCVFDSGGLAGTLSGKDFAARPFLQHAPLAEYQARLAALQGAFIPDYAESLAELALRFVLSVPGVDCATVGMPTVDMVDTALAYADKGPLPADALEAIRRHHVWTKNFYERLS